MKKLNIPLKKRIVKIYLTFFLIFMVFSLAGFSQTASINTTGNPPNASAGLDVDFANLGLLIPRIALTSTSSFAPLPAHVAGMIVYNTATTGDVTQGFYYNDGSKWVSFDIPPANNPGDMQYWNGTNWVVIPAGQSGQLLQLNGSGIPAWSTVSFNIN